MFGGATSANVNADNEHIYTAFGDVWVLSLPGFRWTLASVSPDFKDLRAYQVCNVVGQRQLLSYGGRKIYSVDADKAWSEKDPWRESIGVYDMTTWQWEDRYDAGAERYEQHAELRNWYDAG
jgi:hypothetical protein